MGDQWPIFLYTNYTSSLLIVVSVDVYLTLYFMLTSFAEKAFKHVFTSPSSVNQEPKATHMGNACIHVGRSMGKGNPRGSRVGVCAGMGMGPHTVHPLPIPCITHTCAQIFPWVQQVHCDNTSTHALHMLHRMAARYVTHVCIFTHTYWQTLSICTYTVYHRWDDNGDNNT